ncbi:MAG: deoxyribonuclease IV [Thermoplasmataceae archaeon]
MVITDELKLGGHISTAGGVHLAPERASRFGFRTFQIFSKNQMQWNARPLPAEEIESFRHGVSQYHMCGIMIHASYLLNMGTASPELRKKATDAFTIEIQRADLLGVDYLTFHPGSASGSTPKEAIDSVRRNLNSVMSEDQKCTILLENAAGQGSTIGRSFEEIAEMMDGLQFPAKVGVCLDTCHTWAAGYDIVSPEGYMETMDQFESTIGLSKLKGIHLNDSKKDRGSHLDRHEQIGRGTIGAQGIGNFINDRRLEHTPMILETPLGENGYEADLQVIKSIRGMNSA